MRRFCLLTSMELILIANCSLFYPNNMNSFKSLHKKVMLAAMGDLHDYVLVPHGASCHAYFLV